MTDLRIKRAALLACLLAVIAYALFGEDAEAQTFMDGSQQRQHPSGTVGVHAGSGDGGELLRPWPVEERGSPGESPRQTALPSGSKARVRFPAPGDPSMRTSCPPVLTTTAHAHHRATRGWDSDELVLREHVQARVRVQRLCVGKGKPEAFVRRQIAHARRAYKRAEANPYPDPKTLPDYDYLYGVAGCESGHDPQAVDPSGTYYGLFQFDLGTWASVGGSGNPAQASVEEQYFRAQKLYDSRGSSPWPVCG